MIQSVTKSRKAQGNCRQCNQPIPVGSSYRWSQANRFSPKIKWHATCPDPRPSVLEGNAKRSALMAAQEVANDALDALDVSDRNAEEIDAESITAILTTFAEAVREVAQEFTDSADNIADGFGGDNAVSEELREKGEALESAADDVENTYIEDVPDVEFPDADEVNARKEAEGDDYDPTEDDEAAENAQDELDDWLERVVDEARSAVDELEYP